MRRWARLGTIDFDVRFVPRWRRPGRLVVLWDVSGSMGGYVELYCPWIYRLVHLYPGVGVFPFGTGWHDVTRTMHRSYREALWQMRQEAVGFGSGTTIGAAFQDWLRHAGRRWLTPSTTVVIISDGWDVGDPDMLRQVMAAFRQRAARLIWINPLMATPGFEAKTRALKVAQGYLDAMVSGHDPTSLIHFTGYLQSRGVWPLGDARKTRGAQS